jgi:hypothetical protein
MIDVHLPTTNGRTVILPRYTQPEVDHRMLLLGLNLELPAQPKPRITAAGKLNSACSADFFIPASDFEPLTTLDPLESAKTG